MDNEEVETERDEEEEEEEEERREGGRAQHGPVLCVCLHDK